MDTPTTFGEVLRELRHARGHSVWKFAMLSHHSKSLISKWETGGGVPSADIVEQLDTQLGGGDRLAAAAAVPAPRVTEQLSTEVARRWAHQGPVGNAVHQRAAEAVELDLLAVRGLGLVALNDSQLRPALAARASPLRMRILLLDPDCDAAAQRAAEIGESQGAFAAGIKFALATLEELAAAETGLAIEVGLYARLPIWRIIRVDDTLWVSTFAAGWEGHESSIYEVQSSPRGGLWAGYRRTYEDLHAHSRRVI